jgi:hypothetical protein
MPHRRRRLLVAGLMTGIAFASAALACSQFAGVAPVDDAADVNAVADGGSDQFTTSDGGRDAFFDAALAVGCDGAHLFCDDFDDKAAFPPGRWSTFGASGGSASRVEGGTGGSLAARFSSVSSDSGAFVGPRVTFVLPGPLTGVRCEFDVASPGALAAPDGQATFLMFLRANLSPSSATTFWTSGVRYDAPTGFQLTEEYVIQDAGADGGDLHASAQLGFVTNYRQDGSWTHVSFVVDGASASQSFAVGALMKAGPSHVPTNADSFILELGNEPFDAPQPFAVQFDNVTCDGL